MKITISAIKCDRCKRIIDDTDAVSIKKPSSEPFIPIPDEDYCIQCYRELVTKGLSYSK